MYSVVLMAALTSGAETPDFFFRNRCSGCNVSHGCYTSSCHGCNGGGCYSSGHHGCFGGGCFGGGHGCRGCRGGFLSRLFGRHGCNGCHSSCHSSCHGMVTCNGGCHGGVIVNGGCHGGVIVNGCNGAHGCHGGNGCAGGVVVEPANGEPKEMPMKEEEQQGDLDKGGDKEVQAPVTIIVNLPANAKLMVDGTATKGSAAVRRLVSPALPVGREYHYNLRAEIVREGQNLAQTQRVTVRAGQESQVNFEFTTGGIASR